MKANGFAMILRSFCAIALLAAWMALPVGGSTAFAANSAGDESPASDGSGAAGLNDEVAKDFIKSLADRAIASLTAQSVPYNERVKRFFKRSPHIAFKRLMENGCFKAFRIYKNGGRIAVNFIML